MFNSVASILFTPLEFISVWSAVPDRISLPTSLLWAFKEVHSMVICNLYGPDSGVLNVNLFTFKLHGLLAYATAFARLK